MSNLQPEKPAQSQGLLRSSGVVSAMTMVSRVFGLVRDMVVAYFFGAGVAADAFFLAFKIPNFFRRLFGEGAFNQAFVPVLSEYRQQRPEEVRHLIQRVSGSLGLVLLLITLAGVVGAGGVIAVFAAGFVYHGADEKLLLATDMLRLTFPYLFFISMTALAGSVLNSFGRFGAPAFTPVLLNLCLIAGAVYLRPLLDVPVMALAWSVLLAGVVQLLFLLPFLRSAGLLVWPKPDFRDEGVKRILMLMLPAIFGVSVGQINLLLDTVLASFLETGSLSWLYYSDRLLELPLALFGITIATVILPSLSRKHADASTDEFGATLDWAVRMVFAIGLPASVALVILSDSLITTLFYQGEMTPRDVTMAGYSLSAYGIGLLAHMLVKVLAPGYFSRQDTRTPVRYGIIALVANMVLNLLLVWEFRHAGLALATSLSAFLNAGLLFMGLWRHGVYRFAPGWTRFITQLLLACVALAGLLFSLVPEQTHWLQMLFWERFAAMLGICVAGIAVYGLVLRLTGFDFRKMIR
ncbi:MAG: murein biosynthesis integral membrane protein MurJ [Pseudomonadales bacterium]|nr:murein biosynthesis integral membrane protein MurJ [Pseudomonadales bacterium]